MNSGTQYVSYLYTLAREVAIARLVGLISLELLVIAVVTFLAFLDYLDRQLHAVFALTVTDEVHLSNRKHLGLKLAVRVAATVRPLSVVATGLSWSLGAGGTSRLLSLWRVGAQRSAVETLSFVHTSRPECAYA